MLSIMKWTMAGNRGLLYVRVMRTSSAVLYPADYQFDYGRGFVLRERDTDKVVLISSGRGVHEAMAAADLCSTRGIGVTVVDMPSVDEELLIRLYQSGRKLIFAEQNNGYLWQNFLKVLYRSRHNIAVGDMKNVSTINMLDESGNTQFIHSATYEELIDVFSLSSALIAEYIDTMVKA
jgi:transketolase C-terminal domain/subunit